ncbi:hypothetical protein IQ255_06980 [Pleurocapsales cyanobacterium LEGE 10410]|nr:hypothetical protein [Pleurocapsales cyanobacterium LEGE 10410]
MFYLEPIFEFSRHNCVAICSFLVPTNLIATVATLILIVRERSVSQILWSKRIASVLAITLFLHVSTWFIVGVVTPVTFILFGLGTSCLVINQMAVTYLDAPPS